MNLRLFSMSRLATAVTMQLPELKIAFQFFLPMPAVLKNPIRSFFINLFHSFADTFQNHVGHPRIAADCGRIPDEPAVFFRRITPRWLATCNSLFNDSFHFT